MFALPKLSAWIPARVTHHLVRRALSLVFVLPPDLAIASDLEAGSLVLQDLVLDVGALQARLPPTAPFHLRQGKVRKLVLTLSQPVSWSNSTLSIFIDGLELQLDLKAPLDHHPDQDADDDDDDDDDDLAKSMAHSIIQDSWDDQLSEELDDTSHDHLPGAFYSSSSTAEQPQTEEQTTVLASLITRLLARIQIDVQHISIHIHPPPSQLDNANSNDTLALCANVKKLHVASEAPDRTREVSLHSLALSLRLPSSPDPPSTDSTSIDGSDDDMAMSMAVADLRQSQTFTPPPSTSTARQDENMSAIEESLYLSAEEESDEEDEVKQADESPCNTNVQSTRTSTGNEQNTHSAVQALDQSLNDVNNTPPPQQQPRRSNSPLQPELPESDNDQWQRVFYTGSEPIILRASFPTSGLKPHSIDITLGSLVLLLAPEQIDALLSLWPAFHHSSAETTQTRTADDKPSHVQMDVSIQSLTAILLYHPAVPSTSPTPATFWTRPTTVQPSSSDAYLFLHASKASLALYRHIYTLADLRLAEYIPFIGWLPILTFDSSVGSEYSIPNSGEVWTSDAFPHIQAQDWMDVAPNVSGPMAFQNMWRSSLPKEHLKTSCSVKEKQKPCLRWSIGDQAGLQLSPLHLRLDLGLVNRLRPLLAYLSSAEDTTKPRRRRKNSQSEESSQSFSIDCPIARVEVRMPPSSSNADSPTDLRSGILSLDFHSLSSEFTSEHTTIAFQHACAFFLRASQSSTHMFLHLSSLSDEQPQISVARHSHHKTTHVAITVPILDGSLNKDTVDGLSLFADDATQLHFAADEQQTEQLLSSRYFGSRSVYVARWDREESSRSSDEESSDAPGPGQEGQPIEIAAAVRHGRLRIVFEKHDALHPGVRYFTAAIADLEAVAHFRRNHKSEISLALACHRPLAYEEHCPPLIASSPFTSQGATPALHLRVVSTTDAATAIKETKLDINLNGLSSAVNSDLRWMQDLQLFVKPPKGIFETAVPSERTRLRFKIHDLSLHIKSHLSASEGVLLSLQKATYTANLIPEHPTSLSKGSITGFDIWAAEHAPSMMDQHGLSSWSELGYRRLVNLSDCALHLKVGNGSILPDFDLQLVNPEIQATFCADSLATLTQVLKSATAVTTNKNHTSSPVAPGGAPKSEEEEVSNPLIDLLGHMDEAVFHRAVPLESPLDLVVDDVPADATFLGEEALSGSFATVQRHEDTAVDTAEVIEEDFMIRMIKPDAFKVQDNYLTPQRYAEELAARADACATRLQISGAKVSLQLFDGYDWQGTAQAVKAEARSTRRRLQKIRQYVATGQTGFQTEDAGVPPEDADLLAEIAAEVPESSSEPLDQQTAILSDIDSRISAQSVEDDWESLPAPSALPSSPRLAPSSKVRPLHRTDECALDFQLSHLDLDFSTFPSSSPTACLLNIAAGSLNVVDHIKTSTWNMFMTELRTQDGGFARPTDSPMLRVQYAQDRSLSNKRATEERLKARISPLRLHVDQDAIDFLKSFFAFKAPSQSTTPPPESEAAVPAFIKSAEVFPVKIKLDYKPKRVDYKALKEGRSVELMNFFHFEGSEMTLRHITLSGVAGWDRFGAMLQDIWTPDVKANQLADVVSGIAPVRSVVNVGSGLADLVLLPLDQYRRDKRVGRGLQKGLTSFSKTTALESLRLGARLATGTQVVLEKAEAIIGARLGGDVTAEAVSEDSTSSAPPSRYANQPETFRAGVQEGYDSLRGNLRSTAQTILAVPMEVYERSGSEGPARAVLRAIPIAVLHPAIGASGAMSKALFGLSNQLDSTRELRSDKYKA